MTEKVPNRKIFNEFENYLVIERRFPLNNNIIGIPELFFQGAFFRRSVISPLILNGQGFFEGSSAYSKAWNLGYEIKI